MSKLINLYHLSSKLTVADSFDAIYDATVEALKEVLMFNSFAILIKNNNILEPVRAYGMNIPEEPLSMDGMGITAACAREGKTIYVPDVRKDERYIETNPSTKSEIVAPIKFGNEIIGVINVESDKYDAFTREDITSLEILATMVAAALKNVEYKCKLASSEKKYRSIFENAVEGIYRVEMNGKIVEANPALEKLFGYSQDELREMDLSLLYKHPEDRKKFIENIKKYGMVKNYEVEYVRKDGKTIIGNEFAILVKEKGKEYIDGIIHDITELKEAIKESEFYNSLLRHDIANKLQIIYGYLEIISESIEGEEKEMVEIALKSARSAMELIEDIRKLRKIGKVRSIKVNLGKLIKEIVDEYEKEAKNRGIEIVYNNNDAMVRANEFLREAISNIVWNAIIHSGGNKIKIWIEKKNKTCVFVEDNGIGIKDEIKDKIFEMGFKGSSSNGSGLGLYIAKKIIEELGGEIKVMDSKSGGALFRICI